LSESGADRRVVIGQNRAGAGQRTQEAHVRLGLNIRIQRCLIELFFKKKQPIDLKGTDQRRKAATHVIESAAHSVKNGRAVSSSDVGAELGKQGVAVVSTLVLEAEEVKRLGDVVVSAHHNPGRKHGVCDVVGTEGCLERWTVGLHAVP